ncbi:hypothetical protein K431DRAFT_137351 [Polychaeton citri CBS 116435]|uniref:Uncharacterized protein n=1 Tax=Polychaeton citri CBS 116435 TaxID=1314669 RepID=A0A9P4ULB2_9PEZI|nr:hypothetical protein K431DRAFT_137351 [Polychaeton citri CBS 116435]
MSKALRYDILMLYTKVTLGMAYVTPFRSTRRRCVIRACHSRTNTSSAVEKGMKTTLSHENAQDKGLDLVHPSYPSNL